MYVYVYANVYADLDTDTHSHIDIDVDIRRIKSHHYDFGKVLVVLALLYTLDLQSISCKGLQGSP